MAIALHMYKRIIAWIRIILADYWAWWRAAGRMKASQDIIYASSPHSRLKRLAAPAADRIWRSGKSPANRDTEV
jgi:hypothetical protein